MSGSSAKIRIPLFRPVIRDEAIAAVGDVLRSGWLGLGPRTAEFERAFARYLDVPFCVGLTSCSSAIQLGLQLLDLPEGSEVITTPLTFVSANQAILHAGHRPVFADVQPTTGNLDLASVAERITENTRVIVLMHYGGYPCDLDEIYELAVAHGLHVVEDCAHACGATYRGRRVGSHGDLHAFSFHAGKNLPMGDGGALTLRSPVLDERLRRLRNLGITADTFQRIHGSYSWDYGVTELGLKGSMNDIQAAIGLVQLDVLDEDNAFRAEVADSYREGLQGVAGLELLRYATDRTSSNHLFCVLAEDRDRLLRKLAEQGIDGGVHYRPSYDYALFEAEPLPGVESFWRRAVSLPMHLGLTDEDVGAVTETIRSGW